MAIPSSGNCSDRARSSSTSRIENRMKTAVPGLSNTRRTPWDYLRS